MSFGQWKPTITLKFQSFPKQAYIHKIINEPIDSNPQDDIYNLGEHPCQKPFCYLYGCTTYRNTEYFENP